MNLNHWSVASRGFVRTASLLMWVGLAACSHPSSIQLKAPNVNVPTPGEGKPGPATPGQSAASGAPDAPTSPIATIQPSYGSRLICIDDSLKTASTLSSLVSGSESDQGLVMVETNKLASQLTRDMQNVGDMQAPHLAGAVSDDHALVLFTGRRLSGPDFPIGGRLLYSANVDLSTGLGKATVLSNAPDISGGALSAAHSFGFTLRNYGSSTRGNYAIVPSGAAFRVLQTTTLKAAGSIGLNPSTTFSPLIDEDQKTLTAVVSSGGGLTAVVYHVNINGGSVSLGAQLTAGSGGRLSGPPVANGQGGYFWGETSGAGSSTITIVHASSGHVERATYQAPGGARVYPQIAAFDNQGDSSVVVAYEKVTGGGTAGFTAKGALVVLVIKGGQAIVSNSVDYQDNIIQRMQQVGWDDRSFNVTAVLNSYDRSEVLVQAETFVGPQIFRFDGSMMNFVGDGVCSQLDILTLAR